MGCIISYSNSEGESPTIKKTLSVQLLRRSNTGTSDGSQKPSDVERFDDYIRRPVMIFKRRSSLQRKKELESYTNLFTNNPQQSNFETSSREFADFLINSWIKHLSVSCSPQKNDEDQDEELLQQQVYNNTLRQAFDQLIRRTLGEKMLVVDELYHTIFSEYDLDLTNDGHNKVASLNQLKTRRSPSAIVKSKDIKAIPNPYLSIHLLKDWLLLIFWSLFLEHRILPSPPPPVSSNKFSSLFFSIPSSKKFIINVHKEQTPVLPFDPLPLENSTKRKPSPETTSRSKWIFPRFKSEKIAITTERLSDTTVVPEKNYDLTSREIRKKHALLKYSDVVGVNAQLNESEFIKYVLTGSWWNPGTFFTSLERLSLAICIFSVDKNGTYFPHVYVNKCWESMTGYPREDMLGDDITFLMGNNTEESQSRRLGSCMKHGLRLKIGINLVKADRNDMYCLLSMIPIFDMKKNYKFIVMKLYDVEGSSATICDLKYSDEVLVMIALALRSF